MISKLLTETLYEHDYPQWLETTLQQLQVRDIENLDWEHLIEEIATLGNEQKHKLESYLLQLLKHLLLYQHWSIPDCQNHWEVEIDNFRVEIRKLTKSKNLYNYLLTVLDEVYNDAARQAKKKSGLSCFPQTCPYTIDQILDVEYLPPFTYL
ncbi:DUF29 domain-containing protein [Sphaerospermopsis aphanizomenoides BCCUSP55]|uniref:DUF29 domain-containing protein n=1 Tax=Sphaerospermopsis aphanizomenoides TaxID=459663 RepID=UPI000B1C358F|nr:DUF29 domain-containing protein [Sphaerospermopsis aphanizomenoides]MBK1990334.1 DUF29 domain-containing protein [Sphaerospermopsis aphanizomenoides BCCUSP55]